MSAEEAKERLIESLKDEAKTQAASYINEIVEEAKMTANKEAKKIVIQSIQRVATETAIENSITVFILNRTRSKAVSSVVRDVISVLWRPLPVLRSWWMIRLRLSFFPDSTRFAVRSLVWPCIIGTGRTYPSGSYRGGGNEGEEASGRRGRRDR